MKHIGRKLYHLLGGIGLLSLYYILGREHALMFYAVFFLIALGLDLTRLKIPAVNQFVFREVWKRRPRTVPRRSGQPAHQRPFSGFRGGIEKSSSP